MKLHTLKKTLMGLTISTSIAAFALPASAATYQIQAGDSLWKIANKYQTSVQALQASNPSINPQNLQIWQTLQIPTSAVNTYVLQDGDTFWTIATKLNIKLADLQTTNPGVDSQNLYAGIKLKLPATSVDPASALAYSKVISGIATAYSANSSENGGWGAVDYFGNPLKLGTIAVDPSIIPMGSKVYVTGYQFGALPTKGLIAIATDQGGAIRGNHIDIFIPGSPQEVSSFGIQDVKIYILK
jgi:3D (Asp-Asp-Asp) domain-containing protein